MEHHVTVAIVDDHPVVIEGVISWISADPGRRISVTQVVSDITGLTGPRAADVLILDLELGGRMVADEVATYTTFASRPRPADRKSVV